jgi:WD40 repeat protein
MASHTSFINHSNSPSQSAVVQQYFPILQLPLELIINILKSMNIKDTSKCNLLCRQLHQILNRDDVCRNLFSCHFPHINSEGIEDFSRAYRGLCSGLAKGVYAARDICGISPFVISNNGMWFISFSNDYSKIKIWDLKTLTCTRTIEVGAGVLGFLLVESIVISDDEKLIASFAPDVIMIWDLKTTTCEKQLLRIPSPGGVLAIFDKTLISRSTNTINIWNLETLTETGCLVDRTDWDLPLVISNDGRQLISGSRYSEIKIWNLETRTCMSTLDGHSNRIECLVISNDGRQLVAGFGDGVIKIWDLRTLTCIATLKGHTDCIKSLVFFDDWRLISGSCKGVIKIWDLETFTCTETLGGHQGWITPPWPFPMTES